MIPLSQRDPRWSHIKLGYSKTATIGSDGCFITSIAYILKTDPAIVNDRLKAVGGFVANSGNLIWGKIPVAFPGVTITHLLHAYNNDVVKNNIPAFITVNGAPIGAPLHAVVYIGNQKMMDPWTGNIESTRKYTPLKFVILKGEWRMENIEELRKQIQQLQGALEGEKKKLEGKDEQIREIHRDYQDKLAQQTKTCQTMLDNTKQRVRDAISKLQEIK